MVPQPTSSPVKTPIEPLLVSILMPVYNAEAYIAQAIQSILSQTFPAFELIIINDGCTDSTPIIIKQFDDPRIRVIHNDSPKGVSGTRNQGLLLAKGRYILHQDADDTAEPQRVEKQVAYLETHPDTAVLGCQQRLIREGMPNQPYHPAPANPTLLEWRALFETPISGSAACYRKDWAIRAGGFGSVENWAEDFAMWRKLLRYAKATNLKETLVNYRWHENNTSKIRNDQQMLAVRRQAWLSSQTLLNRTLSFDDYTLMWGLLYPTSESPSPDTLSIAQRKSACELYIELCKHFYRHHRSGLRQRKIGHVWFAEVTVKLGFLARQLPIALRINLIRCHIPLFSRLYLFNTRTILSGIALFLSQPVVLFLSKPFINTSIPNHR